MKQEVIANRQQQVLLDKKWIIFLRRTWLFRFIPFIEMALAAGSMATGNVHSDSDFDVIVGAREGRIFTARFFSVLAFGLFGWRRKKLSHKESASDTICLNHFITRKSYRLSPPYNEYWKGLYRNLVPLYGDPGTIRIFFAVNEWREKSEEYRDDLRHRHRTPYRIKIIAERILSGRFGSWLESRLRSFQVARIEKGLANESGYKPRIIYNDQELEFHPDTRRIENLKN